MSGDRRLGWIAALAGFILEGKLRVESGWLIVDPGDFASRIHLILRVCQGCGTSFSF
jgi:hypothetical protein